jgi:hypothetical protein
MCPARRPFWSVGLLVAAVLLTALLGSAASAQVATLGSPAPQASAAPSPPPADGPEALLAWASCMRENGVAMDDPQFGIDGALIGGLGKDGPGTKADAEGEAYQLASEACSDLLSSFKAPLDAAQQAERTAQLVVWAGCMREQGIDIPDPQPDGSFADYDWKLDLKGEDYIAADQACLAGAGDAAGK